MLKPSSVFDIFACVYCVLDKLPPRFRRQLEMQSGQPQGGGPNSTSAAAPAPNRDNFFSAGPPQNMAGPPAPYMMAEDRYRDNFFGPPSAQMRV